MTDIVGSLLAVKVYAANIHDAMGGCHVCQVAKNKYLSIRCGCGDEGYRGIFVEFVWLKYCEAVDVVEKIKSKEWVVLLKRRCVERTFAWVNWSRILSKGYEIKAVYAENSMISHLHTLLRRN